MSSYSCNKKLVDGCLRDTGCAWMYDTFITCKPCRNAMQRKWNMIPENRERQMQYKRDYYYKRKKQREHI